MPYKYAKPGTQIYQIRLKSGDHLRDPLERKVQLSFPLQSRTKASDTPTTRRSTLGVKTRKEEKTRQEQTKSIRESLRFGSAKH